TTLSIPLCTSTQQLFSPSLLVALPIYLEGGASRLHGRLEQRRLVADPLDRRAFQGIPDRRLLQIVRRHLLLELTAAAPAKGALRDRKSTRLNSSHVKISYAVFCLKKKK